MKKSMILLFALALIPTFAIQAIFTGCSSGAPLHSGGSEIPGGDAHAQDPGNDTPDPGAVSVTEADVILFIGQSNMAGRGVAKQATKVEEGHAYEFRAISDPTKLYPLTEPFGVSENDPDSGVSENKKTGSMVSAFCESYYAATGRPVVAVSCSKGGEKISFFDTKTKVYDDAVSRLNSAKEFMETAYKSGASGLKPGRTYIVWMQGESDGDAGTPAGNYTKTLKRIVNGFKKDAGVDQFFIIPIGEYNGNDSARNGRYTEIRQAQIDFCEDSADATVISLKAQDLRSMGLMKDEFHFKQEGYELLGKDAGSNTGYFVNEGKKPVCERSSGT